MVAMATDISTVVEALKYAIQLIKAAGAKLISDTKIGWRGSAHLAVVHPLTDGSSSFDVL